MRLVIAPNSFKGTLSAARACAAIAAGARQVFPNADIVEAPLADGGEGTVDAIVTALGGRRCSVRVRGPLGDPVEAVFGMLAGDRRAVIEMASASGILLVPADQRDALRASTYGTGELIQAALAAGARELLVGIGGSATTDGGCGMAQALGVRFLGGTGAALPPGIGGGDLRRIARIDLTQRDPRIADAKIDVLCDVTNPLAGAHGAACVYGPQKGASPAEVDQLDRGLAHLGELIVRDLHHDVRALPGAGAAGGLGAGLVAFAGGHLGSGARAVIDFIGLEARCRGADLILTGEGCLDRQSLSGKAVAAVAELGARLGIPVAAVAGRVALPEESWRRHFTAVAVGAGTTANAAQAVTQATATLLRSAPEWMR